MPTPRFHRLTVAGVRPLTSEAVALRLAVPDALAGAFRFLPGQYVTLRATAGGEEVRRAYSISSRAGGGPGDGPGGFEVGIKRVPGGRFSNLARELGAGDALEVMAPEGRFVARPGEARRVLLVAAGSGITPCLSIAATLLHDDPEARVALVYGNRDAGSIMFRAELDALKDRYTGRFSLVHVLSGESRGAALLEGRLSPERLAALDAHGLIDIGASDAIYVCGPEAMADGVVAWLAGRGVPDDRVHRERFVAASAGTAGPGPVDVPAAAPVEAPRDGARATSGSAVDVVVDGARHRIEVDGARETVLAAAHRQGLELPFSCAGGMCCTCRCRVVDGAATMDANYSLQGWEVEAGFTLACQARPTSRTLTLDFDVR